MRNTMKYKAPEITQKWPKPARSFNAQLVPNKLIELAKSGTYYESRVLPEREPMTRQAYFKSLAAKRKEHPFTRKVANGVYLY